MKTSKYDTIIEAAARRNGIPLDIFKKLINTESSGNSSAVSPKGAKGLGQLMDATGMEVFKNKGYKGTYDPFNPEQNVNIASDYYKQLLDKYNGNTTLAAAAYNAGPGAVDKYGGIPPYAETKEYVKDVAPENPLKTIVKNKIQDKVIDSVFSSAPSADPVTPVGSMMDGSTMMSNGTTLPMSSSGGAVPPADAGTSMFDFGTPSTAGYISAGVRAIKGIGGYLNNDGYEKDRNKQLYRDGTMAAANYATGGLAELGKLGLDTIAPGMVDKIIDFNTMLTPGYHLMNMVGSKKGKDQVGRDQIRDVFENNGIAVKNKDGAHEVTLANGAKFNIGMDGGARLKNKGTNIDGKTERQYSDIDYSDDLAKNSVVLFDDYVRKSLGKGATDKQIADGVGNLVNAATSNAKTPEEVKANADAILSGGKMTPEDTKFQKPILSVMNQPTTQTAEPAPTFEDKLTKIKKDLSMIQNIGGTNANDYAVQYAQNLQQSGVTDKSETAQVVYSAGGALKGNKKLLSKSTSIFNQ